MTFTITTSGHEVDLFISLAAHGFFPIYIFSAHALLITYASQVNISFLKLLPVQCKYLFLMISNFTVQHGFECWWPLNSLQYNKTASPKLIEASLFILGVILNCLNCLNQNNRRLVLFLFEFLQFFIPNHLQPTFDLYALEFLLFWFFNANKCSLINSRKMCRKVVICLMDMSSDVFLLFDYLIPICIDCKFVSIVYREQAHICMDLSIY